jgi:hypothetical protein
VIITAIFRDTTLQAFEGWLFGPATGWCGLLTKRTTDKALPSRRRRGHLLAPSGGCGDLFPHSVSA